MTMRYNPKDSAKAEAQQTKIMEQGVKTAEVTSTKASVGASGKPKKQGMMDGGPQHGDEGMNMAGKLDEHEKKMGIVHKEMEANMKAQMKKMIDKQTAELRKSMEELELKALRAAQNKPAEKKKISSTFSTSRVYNYLLMSKIGAMHTYRRGSPLWWNCLSTWRASARPASMGTCC